MARGTIVQRAAFARVWQVPEDRVFILKQVAVSTDSTSNPFMWNLSVSDADVNHFVFLHQPAADVTYEQVELWAVINPLDWITIYTDPAPLRYWVSGALLTRPSDLVLPTTHPI